MRAVLGFLLLLVGITVGWLVLSGQLPVSSSASSAATSSSGAVVPPNLNTSPSTALPTAPAAPLPAGQTITQANPVPQTGCGVLGTVKC